MMGNRFVAGHWEAVMRWIAPVAITLVLALAQALPSEGQARQADLRINATGTALNGDLMRIACDLDFHSVPSNTFEGACRITVGADELTFVGLDGDRQRLPTVVLNGRVTIRGIAEVGHGRFKPLADHGLAGLPLSVEIDPLGRAWLIRGDTPGGGSETVTSGVLTAGSVVIGIR